MKDIIKIGCPICGSVLSVQNQLGIESKNVTCPVCKHKSPFSAFKKIVDKEEPTEYPEQEATRYEEETQINEGPNFTLGKLIIPALNISFQLKPGKNLIGRKASGSAVPYQIPCSTKRMSREHLVVEVKKLPGKGFVHFVSLYKQHVNPTFVGQNKLEYGDCVVLHHHDVIHLPDVDARFEIPDEEGTEF